jgi:hypothetical protein
MRTRSTVCALGYERSATPASCKICFHPTHFLLDDARCERYVDRRIRALESGPSGALVFLRVLS